MKLLVILTTVLFSLSLFAQADGEKEALTQACLKEKQRQIEDISKMIVKLNCEGCKKNQEAENYKAELHMKRIQISQVKCPDDALKNLVPCQENELSGCMRKGDEISCADGKVYKLSGAADQSLRENSKSELSIDPSTRSKPINNGAKPE